MSPPAASSLFRGGGALTFSCWLQLSLSFCQLPGVRLAGEMFDEFGRQGHRPIQLPLGFLDLRVAFAPLKRFLAGDFVRSGCEVCHLFLGNNSLFRRGYLGKQLPQLPHAKK